MSNNKKIPVDALKLGEAIHLLKQLLTYDVEVEYKAIIKTSLEKIDEAIEGGGK